MPTIAINGAPSPDHTTGFTGFTPTHCQASLPVATIAANGNRPIQITALQLYLGGNGAARTVHSYVADASGANEADTGTYTVGAASGAATTGLVSLTKNVSSALGQDFMVGFAGESGSIYFGRTADGGRTVQDGSDTTSFANYTLAGSFSYIQVPSAPTLSMNSTSGTSATLGWTPPGDNGGGTITGYTIQYSTDPTFATSSSVTPTGLSTTITGLTGLSSGTVWYFHAGARNAAADAASTTSVWSNTVSSTFAYYWDDIAVSSLDASAQVGLQYGVTLTEFDDDLSRTNWANQVKVIYSWTTAAGVATQQMDFADGSTAGVPGALFVQNNDNTPYPGAGAAAAILARMLSYGHAASLNAVTDLQFNPRQLILLTLPSGYFVGTISAVTFDFAAKTMSVTTRNLT